MFKAFERSFQDRPMFAVLREGDDPSGFSLIQFGPLKAHAILECFAALKAFCAKYPLDSVEARGKKTKADLEKEIETLRAQLAANGGGKPAAKTVKRPEAAIAVPIVTS